MELLELEKVWEALGERDPLWSVLSGPRLTGGRWDKDEFFRTGEPEISRYMGHLEAIGAVPPAGRCLDFGCGVGRCAPALGSRFAEYHGVDISESMLKLARRYNASDRFSFHHNTRDDLSIFGDATFDLVYSRFVLQHVPAEHSKRYIAEFMRVLRPGGIALFQVPKGIQSLDCAAFHAEITIERGLRAWAPWARRRTIVLEPANEYVCRVRVQNRSNVTWPRYSIRLGNHWLDNEGCVTRLDDGRAELPSDVPSGGQVTTTIRLTSPSSPGDYLLELDLVQEAVAWFADRGSETLRVPVVVTEGGTHRVRWARDRRRAQTDETLPFYSIYAVPEEEVAAIVQTAGGEVVNVVDDESCGGGWVSRLYTATKVPAAD